MKFFYKGFIIMVTIALLLSGCTSENPIDDNKNSEDQVPSPVSPDEQSKTDPEDAEPNDADPDSSEPNDSTEPSPSDDKTEKETFKDAFSEELLNDPQAFMGKLIPNFRIGLSKDDVKQALGEPDNSIDSTEPGVIKEWTYDNVEGFQLVISYNSLDELHNFRLTKRLGGKGHIPKYISITTPEAGEKLTYKELGFEGVILGDSLDSVIQRYGEALYGFLSYNEMYGYNLALVYRGVTVHVLIINNEKDPYVHYIETNQFGTVSTYRGIHVGNTKEEVLEKYGPTTSDERETDFIYSTEDLWFGIKFIMKDGKVEKIDIYQAS